MLAGQLALAGTSAGFVLVLDQVTKSAALRLGHQGPAQPIPFRLRVVRNPRGGIGRFTVPAPIAIACGTVVSIAALALIAMAGPLSRLTVLGLGVAIGGTAGNLADLLLRGHIVDFVSIGRWPVFNLADVALCIGAGLTVLGLWWPTK